MILTYNLISNFFNDKFLDSAFSLIQINTIESEALTIQAESIPHIV